MDIFLVENNKLFFTIVLLLKMKMTLCIIFFVVEQFDLDPNDFEIQFLGRIDAFESYYDIVKNYHYYITFSNDNHVNKIEFSKHHAPYLSSCFN